MKTKFYCIFTALLTLGMSISVFAQVQEDNLVGWWLFDDKTDETENWGDIILRGAEIKDGQLVCQRDKWANSIKYSGPNIRELTLVSWVILDDLNHTHGSALTLDRADLDQFCAIVYAEKVARQWMPGSSGFQRTENFPDAVNENKTGEMVLLAITYKDVNGQYEITGYRNGESLGTFRKGGIKEWTDANAEAIWGMRHSTGVDNGVGDSITARIEESRIYNVALTEEEIQTMNKGDLPVEPRGKLATRWGKIKRQ